MKPSRERGLTWLTLFTSTGTWLCCVLPITLINLGLGAALASLISSMPFLVVLTQHKIWIFVLSAMLLIVSGWTLFFRPATCPTSPELAEQCRRARRWNHRLFWLSTVIWGIGFIAAFVAYPLHRWLETMS